MTARDVARMTLEAEMGNRAAAARLYLRECRKARRRQALALTMEIAGGAALVAVFWALCVVAAGWP
ncbi:MAG: hypothetical protein NT029_08160 [Armatimonadetes bacterium]|nr:hypothetical protein [Armatimonadota bacterium]